MNARGLLSVLFHAEKALDLVQTARELGVIAKLDAGAVTLGELCAMTGARPLRLYKLLDGLESLGLILREQPADDLFSAQYVSREPPLAEAVEAVLGEASIERNRDTYPWRAIHGRLADVLRGRLDSPFTWPPGSDEAALFEASMAAGCGPIIESWCSARHLLFGSAVRSDGAGTPATGARWLDVGGGDGTVAEALLRIDQALKCDVFNLPAAAPLVTRRAHAAGLDGRLGFASGDFLREPLPRGYDVLSFIRVLHDWPAKTTRMLLAKATEALPPGGRIVICEEFRTLDRLAAQFFWTYFLTGVDACVSRLREIEWYTDALRSLGFAEIRIVRGSFDLVTAIRP